MNERDEQIIRDALAERRRDHFAEGFADRAANAGATIVRLRRRWRDSFAVSTTIAAAAVFLLAVYNVRHRRADEGQSVAAALFGITPRTTSSMTIDEIYGLGSLGGGG